MTISLCFRTVQTTFWSSFVLLLPALAVAQTPGGSLAANEREITGGDLALLSYVALWVLVLGVVLVVFVRQMRLNQELGNLERKLDKLAGLSDEESGR